MPRGSSRGRRRPLLVRLTALAALVGATACYRSVDAPPAALAPGAVVALFLTPDGERALAPRLGEATTIVEGRVERTDTAGVALVVSRTTKRYGGTVPWLGERVTVPAGAIAEARARVVDRRRTTLATLGVAAAAVAALAVLVAQHGTGRGDEGGGGGGPTP